MVKGKSWADVPIRCYEALVLPRALRKARKIICCSAFVQNSALVAPYINKSTVISPGVDTSLFVPGPQRVAGHGIMHVGGLKTGERYKGLETSLAEQLGITGHVKFCGRLAGPQLISAYQAADVLIVPSTKESFGMVILEAMACGVPPVASAAEGIPDVVRDGEFGFLVEPVDIAGFTKKIRELFDDAALSKRFSQNARRAALAREYAWPRQVERTAQLLEALL